jgi:hypothetical protein
VGRVNNAGPTFEGGSPRQTYVASRVKRYHSKNEEQRDNGGNPLESSFVLWPIRADSSRCQRAWLSCHLYIECHCNHLSWD